MSARGELRKFGVHFEGNGVAIDGKHLRLKGNIETAGAVSMRVLARDQNGRVLLATTATIPSAVAGFAKGCLLIESDAGSGIRALYENAGTATVCLFVPVGSIATNRVEIFDDFNYQAIAETYTPWILNSGSDPQAVDAAISAQEGGAIVLVTGDDDGVTAVDATQIVCATPMQADSGGLVFETRLRIKTAVTNVSVFAGFTDVTTLEEPASIATATITTNASDAAGFLFDTSATVDQWWMVSVDTNVDDTGSAALGVVPVADVFQVLRIEVSADGNTIKFFINGALAGTLSAIGVTPTANLYATIIACGDGTASKSVDVDYIYAAHTR